MNEETQTNSPATEIAEEKSWTVANNLKEIEDYFAAQPAFTIKEYMGKFFIEIRMFKFEEKYTDLSKCISYQPLKNDYIQPEYNTLKEAHNAILLYRQIPVVHKAPETEEEAFILNAKYAVRKYSDLANNEQ